MGVDWGLLGALRGRDNFDAIKQEKQRELQYQGVLNKMQEDANAEQQQKQAAIQQYLQTANNLEVLPQGMERIKAVNEPLQAAIADNIKKYGGDLDKYWKVQGQVDMQNYLQQLLHNPETTKALMSASAVARYNADKQAGLQERGEVDPNTGTLVNPFENQIHDYLVGNTDILNYKGAFKPADFTPTFNNEFGKNPYKSEAIHPLTLQDRIAIQAKKSLPVEDANQQALMESIGYKNHLAQGGQPYYTKALQYHPSAGMSGDADQEQAMKYILEGVKGALETGEPNPNFWQSKEVIQPSPKAEATVKNVFGFPANKPIVAYTSDRLKGLPLGKQTIPKYDVSKDAAGNPTLVENGVQQIDNSFEGFYKAPDGKVYYHTTKSDIEGQDNPDKKYIPFTDASIDELVLGAPPAQRPKLAASLRKGLKQMDAYKNQTPTFTQKTESKKVYKGLDVSGNPIFE